jgi:uncharacterized lipoprotein NlpE involved in copper resistance
MPRNGKNERSGGTMKRAIITVIIFLFLLAACNNEADPSPDSPVDNNSNTYTPYTITYSAGDPDISMFLEWEWAKVGTDFVWLFQPDGSVSVIHCCGEVYKKQFSYLFQGNVLVTYGSEMSFDEIEVTHFAVADNGLSFSRDNGTSFTRGKNRDTSSSGSVLNLSNVLLGTWNGEDGTEYVFSSDTGLMINSDEYGYFVRYSELLILGTLVDGTQAVLQEYRFNRAGNKLYLRCADGNKYTLTLSE